MVSDKYSGESKFTLWLTCKNCHKKFASLRYKKYCSDECRIEAGRKQNKIRYQEVRLALLESRKGREGKEVK